MRRRGALVPNPPWITHVMGEVYDQIQDKLRDYPAWVPRISDVRPMGSDVRGKIVEYGCGTYGCVLPTLDSRVVIKVTTDDTEAEFAGTMAATLVRPICVRYFSLLETDAKHDNRNVTILWRESAEYVGDLESYLIDQGRSRDVDFAYDMIDDQHTAGVLAFKAILDGSPAPRIHEYVVAWLEACEVMARQTRVPELRTLGDGLVEVYGQQHILFGDMHDGNIGQVTRGQERPWVITDPGHVAVVMP